MDQTNAQVGQEEAPEGQINAKTPEERPAQARAQWKNFCRKRV